MRGQIKRVQLLCVYIQMFCRINNKKIHLNSCFITDLFYIIIFTRCICQQTLCIFYLLHFSASYQRWNKDTNIYWNKPLFPGWEPLPLATQILPSTAKNKNPQEFKEDCLFKKNTKSHLRLHGTQRPQTWPQKQSPD